MKHGDFRIKSSRLSYSNYGDLGELHLWCTVHSALHYCCGVVAANVDEICHFGHGLPCLIFVFISPFRDIVNLAQESLSRNAFLFVPY